MVPLLQKKEGLKNVKAQAHFKVLPPVLDEHVHALASSPCPRVFALTSSPRPNFKSPPYLPIRALMPGIEVCVVNVLQKF